MTETENLVLEQLRAIRADIADLRESFALHEPGSPTARRRYA